MAVPRLADGLDELLFPDLQQAGRLQAARRWLAPLGLAVVVLALGLLADTVPLPPPGRNASVDQVRGLLQEMLALVSGYAPKAAVVLVGVAVLTLLVDLGRVPRIMGRGRGARF